MTATPATPAAPAAIAARGLTKLYRRVAPGYRLRTLKSALLHASLVQGLKAEEATRALDDVSFEVARGEAFGVIGKNGSGKSTLLKLMAGLLRPTSGELSVEGRVAALIELGAGFHPEISGRENIYINGAVLGLSRRDIDRRYDEIVEFSGLGDFVEEPVKNYSSGMYVRLGFSVAIHTEPEVLLVDEVLAVGDEAFAHRCLRRIEEHLARNRTLLVVSHSLDLIEGLCDRVLWLDHGRAQGVGPPRQIIDAYRQSVAEEEGREHRRAKEQVVATDSRQKSEEVNRWGSGQAEVVAARILAGDGEERYHLTSGEKVAFAVEVVAHEPLSDFVFGLAIATPRGVECWGTNTDLAGYLPRHLQGRAVVRLECPQLRLAPGEYVIDVAVHARDGAPYDYRRSLISFTVSARDRGVGVYFPEHRWEFSGGVSWRERAD